MVLNPTTDLRESSQGYFLKNLELFAAKPQGPWKKV
jgi:hypothetical protein